MDRLLGLPSLALNRLALACFWADLVGAGLVGWESEGGWAESMGRGKIANGWLGQANTGLGPGLGPLLGGREVQLLLVTGGEGPQCDQRMTHNRFVQTVAAGAVWLALCALFAVIALGFCGYFD